MAGDWIKMRNELWTHPKFICLVNSVAHKEGNSGFAAYVLGDDLLIPSYPPSNEKITDVLLHTVTKRALRDVTMCSLLRVWCAVNAHAKVVECDAICHPMSLSDLDEIAGFDGFGEALELSGWVEHDEPNYSLVFKNFCEYNEPVYLRKKPAKSNAERQAEFRARNKEKTSVTKSNESNAREEKRREDISKPKGLDSVLPKKGTQLPDGFKPNDTGTRYAEDRNIDTEVEIESFCNWHKAKGSLMKDWQAAWRTWCDKAQKFQGKGGKGASESFFERDQRSKADRISRFTGQAPRPAGNVIDVTPSAKLIGGAK